MKKIIVGILILFSIFFVGCNLINSKDDLIEENSNKIEENIKSSIPKSIHDNIILITKDSTYNATITWNSSNEEVLTATGVNINLSDETIDVLLTYVISIEDKQREGTISIAVKPHIDFLRLDVAESSILEEIPDEVFGDLRLPEEIPAYNAKIEWSSSNEEILTKDGINKNKSLDPKDVTISYKITIGKFQREGQKKVKVLTRDRTIQLNALEERIKNSIPKTTVKDLKLYSLDTSMNARIVWESSNENVISTNGTVYNNTENPVLVTLTYTIIIEDEERKGTIQVEVPHTENFEFKLDYEEYYIDGTNQEFSLWGTIYKNGEEFNAYFSKVKIEEEYDASIPGEYDLTGSIEFNAYYMDKDGNNIVNTINLKDSFKLIVLSPLEVTFEEINTQKIESVEYSFGFENYYIICPEDQLIIIDLHNPNEHKTVEINGRCNSYFFKDGYLYISSVEPYEDEYSDNFTGYISKIDLENLTVVEEIKVNSAPDSIVVDKRNNIIISKEQNQHVSIDYLDMNTKQISVMSEGYYGDKLIYNEQDDMVIIVSTFSTTQPNIYKYNEQDKRFDLVKRYYELDPEIFQPEILERYDNTFIYGNPREDKAYAEFVNGEVYTKKIPIVNQKQLNACAYEVCITEDNFVFVRFRPKHWQVGTSFCDITVYDKETNKYQTYQTLTNYNGNELDSVYMYNGNIYVFDKTEGKILTVK